MNFVDDVHFVSRPHRFNTNVRSNVSYVVNPAIRRTVDFQYVDVTSGSDPFADFALVARISVSRLRAVQRLGQNPRRRRLANSASPSEEVSMSDPVSENGVSQSLSNVLLPDDNRATMRPKSPGQNRVRTS